MDPRNGLGCLGLMNQYCDSLYAPGADGNLVIKKRKGTPIYILQGKTANGLNQVFHELAKSKLRNQNSFPKDFLAVLKAHHYFQKLEDLLERKPFSNMNMTDRVESTELESDVDYIWGLSIKDTLILRLSNKFPEYPSLSEDAIPPELAMMKDWNVKFCSLKFLTRSGRIIRTGKKYLHLLKNCARFS